MAECVMMCLFNSLEKMSEGKRRVFCYASFIVGGTLTIGGLAGFATQHRGYAFIVVVSGIFILITTGILWDTMIPQCGSSPRAASEAPTAPREDDDLPPDYESVVKGDSTKDCSVSRSNSKWSLYNQSWCPSFNPRSGYGKTATSESTCTEVVVSDRPPSYRQSQSRKQPSTQTPLAAVATVEISPNPTADLTKPGDNEVLGTSQPTTARVQITRETQLEIIRR